MKNSYCMMFVLLFVVGCASQKSVEYPRANKAQENAHSLYEENKEWAKETAEQVVDYAAVGAAKAGEAYDTAVEKAEDWKNRFKKQVDEYKENHK